MQCELAVFHNAVCLVVRIMRNLCIDTQHCRASASYIPHYVARHWQTFQTIFRKCVCQQCHSHLLQSVHATRSRRPTAWREIARQTREPMQALEIFVERPCHSNPTANASQKQK